MPIMDIRKWLLPSKRNGIPIARELYVYSAVSLLDSTKLLYEGPQSWGTPVVGVRIRIPVGIDIPLVISDSRVEPPNYPTSCLAEYY